MIIQNFKWEDTKQFSIFQLLLSFVVPSLFAFTGFRIILPILVKSGIPVIIAWHFVALVVLLILVIVAIILLRRESKQLNISIVSRMCLKKLSIKQWLVYMGIMLVWLGITMLATHFVEPFMKITGLNIPDYMPFFLNPTIDPTTTDSSILSPGFPLKWQFVLLPFVAIVLLLNILAEELYFRAWILPKIAKYKNIGWIANAILFALYHSFQLWLFPTLVVGSLVFAFVVYRSRSLLPVFITHLITNFFFTILGIAALVIG